VLSLERGHLWLLVLLMLEELRPLLLQKVLDLLGRQVLLLA
jgi:hypothetical protein